MAGNGAREPGGEGGWNFGETRAGRFIGDAAGGRADPRIAWLILGGAMLVSLAYCLYATRGSTFTGDEIAWVAFSPDLTFRGSIEPHSGHLIFVTLWLYKAILGTVGSDYLTFRLLTLAMVFSAVTLLFVYSRKRVGDFVALAPCLVLLFFGNDAGNLLQGIGFTIMLAVTLGMVSLLAVERNTRRGDGLACAALTLAVVSFTLALPFLAGAIVAIALSRERWRRIWLVAIPLLVYLAWRVWLIADQVEITNGSADPAHILLLPSWTFQSLSGILSALTGFNYNFESSGWLPPGEMAGPVLALAFLGLLGWRIHKVKPLPWFLVPLTIMAALFASQVLGWIPDVREPGSSRYLFPGAFAVILVTVEAFRRYRFSPTVFVVIWVVALSALATNIYFISDSGRSLRDRAPTVAAEVTASNLVNTAYPYPPSPKTRSLLDLVSDHGIAVSNASQEEYGGIGFTEDELLAESEELRTHADSIMGSAFGVLLIPEPGGRATGCRRLVGAGEPGITIPNLPKGGVVLKSPRAGSVSLRRFGTAFTVPAGELLPGRFMRLYIPVDDGKAPWQLRADVPGLEVCRLPLS